MREAQTWDKQCNGQYMRLADLELDELNERMKNK